MLRLSRFRIRSAGVLANFGRTTRARSSRNNQARLKEKSISGEGLSGRTTGMQRPNHQQGLVVMGALNRLQTGPAIRRVALSPPAGDQRDETMLTRLIGHIYDAALDAALWPEVLAKIGVFLGGEAGGILSKDAVSKAGTPTIISASTPTTCSSMRRRIRDSTRWRPCRRSRPGRSSAFRNSCRMTNFARGVSFRSGCGPRAWWMRQIPFWRNRRRAARSSRSFATKRAASSTTRCAGEWRWSCRTCAARC